MSDKIDTCPGCGAGYRGSHDCRDADGDLRAKLEAERLAHAQTREREAALRAWLEEALEGWEDGANYKGDHLKRKHGDAEDIARIRAALSSSSPRYAPPELVEKLGAAVALLRDMVCSCEMFTFKSRQQVEDALAALRKWRDGR